MSVGAPPAYPQPSSLARRDTLLLLEQRAHLLCSSVAEVDLLELLLPHLSVAQLSEPAGADGFTALHTCADMGAMRTARRLLADERVDSTSLAKALDKRGRTVREVAEAAGHVAFVELL